MLGETARRSFWFAPLLARRRNTDCLQTDGANWPTARQGRTPNESAPILRLSVDETVRAFGSHPSDRVGGAGPAQPLARPIGHSISPNRQPVCSFARVYLRTHVSTRRVRACLRPHAHRASCVDILHFPTACQSICGLVALTSA